MKRRIVGFVAVVAQLSVAAGLLHLARRQTPGVVQELVEKVPATKEILAFRGPGFRQDQRRAPFHSTGHSKADAESIRATAPARVSGSFEVGRSRPWSPFNFRLPGTRDIEGRSETGLVTYAGAYDGVDVLVARDPEKLELAFAVHDPKSLPNLRIRFGSGSSLAEVAENGGVTISSDRDRARRLQADRPIAFDARGQRRDGRYHVEGRDLVVEMDFRGLVPPVVVNPTFYIPFFTIANDSRQPGNEIYSLSLLSREAQVTVDGATGRPVLIRPIRSQQPEDFASNFGMLSQPGYPRVPPTARTPGISGPTLGPAELDEWTRVQAARSEVWTWHDGRWHLEADTGLPGLIDAAINYDPQRGRFVAFGGGVPAFQCTGTTTGTSTNIITSPARCTPSSSWQWDATYERTADGVWVAKRLPNSPAPRVRAAIAPFQNKMLLFGGRALLLNATFSTGGKSPDNLSGGLLNDTWSYDGTGWAKLPVGNPPPPQEGAQLVVDSRRGRLVLIGGSTGSVLDPYDPVRGGPGTQSGDSFSIWEFDGTDWLQRFGPNDPALPGELRGRRGVAAAWHPGRGTVVLFGGFVSSMPPCPYSGIVLENAQSSAIGNATARAQLESQNCIEGYVHDWWEWDGSELRQLARASFAGYLGETPLPDLQLALYRQVQGDVPAPGAGPGGSGAGSSKLWPWRYDPRSEHFHLRTALERSFAAPGPDTPPAKETGATTTLPGTAQPPEFVSPSFVPRMRPHMVYESSSGKMMIMPSPTPLETRSGSRVFLSGVNTWEERTPRDTPFDLGANDFFAATWDTTSNRALLFDPRDGTTWKNENATGWQPAQVASNLPPWNVSDAGRPPRIEADPESALRDLHIPPKLPRMAFDRDRGVAVLFHNNTLFELSAGAWLSRPVPSALSSCVVSTLMAYDQARHRTVLTGCRAPAQTWEWDGGTWYGPFPSPYTASVDRSQPFQVSWRGPLQLPWVHPNAIAELPSLGGVGVLDIDGTLRVWNGETWSSGPQLPEGRYSDVSQLIISHPGDYGVFASSQYFGQLAVPVSSFPPLVEDSSSQRVLAFRDGLTGLRQLDLREAAENRSWSKLVLGRSVPDPSNPNLDYPSVHPHPLELWSPEQFVQTAMSDPAHKVTFAGTPFPNGVEQSLVSFYWPFQILKDAPRNRIFLLTHRGALWQLGNEPVGGIGDPCTTIADCGEGVACVNGLCSAGGLGNACATLADCAAGTGGCIDGVCCDNSACGTRCNVCNGSQPGHCEEIPTGQPDPKDRCGTGACAGLCPGSGTIDPFHGTQPFFPTACLRPHAGEVCGPTVCDAGFLHQAGTCSSTSSQCVPSASATPCPGGLGCADETSCKATCASRADCLDRFSTCDISGTACVKDRASDLATGLGILPADWTPEVTRSPQELAEFLKGLGFQEDAEGRIYYPDLAIGGLTPVFNPNLLTPVTGLQRCAQRIQSCRYELGGHLDECVAALPRCIGAEPWHGDSAGWDCCPEACLVEYFTLRGNKSAPAAYQGMLESTCYPGIEDFVRSGAQP